MNVRSDTLVPWLYKGVWGVLVRWFRVPDAPPTMPVVDGETIEVFRAAPGYLRYRRMGYWIGIWFMLALWIAGIIWLIIVILPVGLILALPLMVLYVVYALLNYVALYLEYDTTWYAVGPNSIRTRSGVWINREITINYDNVQNVVVSQGPLQRYFGISNVRVDTAGTASTGGQNQLGQAAGVSLQGLDNAEAIKTLIQARCDGLKTAGLGDEVADAAGQPGRGWSESHLALLREIRDAAAALKG